MKPPTPADRPPIASRLLELFLVAAVVCALLAAVTGGFDLRRAGIPFRSGSPHRALLLAAALALVYFVSYRARATQRAVWIEAHLRRGLARLISIVDRWSGLIACGIALIAIAVGARYGTFVAGGSDSYGYVSQADLWLSGNLTVEQPLAQKVPWRDADRTFAPLGYRPSIAGGAIVPLYPPGLSVLMAVAKLGFGNCGPFFVTPLLGALAVWLTYRLGASLWSQRVGLAAAALLASSPTFVYMLLQPMSDVPATAAVAAALVLALGSSRRRALWTGLAVSAAICIRPNLAPLAPVLLAGVAAQTPSWRARTRLALQFGMGAAPLLLAVALLSTHLYGAPWASGYGDLGALYSWGFVVPNLSRYSRWLLQTETPLVACVVVPLVALRRLAPRQRLAIGLSVALVACVWLSYLFYLPFEAWWFLRFLLPALPPILVLAVVGWRMALGWLRPTYRQLALGGIALALVAAHTHFVRQESVLQLWDGESDYVSVAAYVKRKLPENAIVISMLHSGSLRLYSGRLTLRYDWLPPKWWPRVLRVLTRQGYRPYVLLASTDEAQFRERFGLSDAADAPGTVMAEMRNRWTARLYDPLREAAPSSPERIPVVVPRLCTGCR